MKYRYGSTKEGHFMKYRTATVEDHEEIVKLAKLSEYTKDFSNRLMFSSDTIYAKGWIRIVETTNIIGFSCVRHKVRAPVTMLYFIGICPEHRNEGIGETMIEQIMAFGPHYIMQLNVMKSNRATRFYTRLGFVTTEEVFEGKGLRMEKRWPATMKKMPEWKKGQY